MAESQPDTRKDEESREAEIITNGQDKQEGNITIVAEEIPKFLEDIEIPKFLEDVEKYLKEATNKRENREIFRPGDWNAKIEDYKKLVLDLINPDSKNHYEKVHEAPLAICIYKLQKTSPCLYRQPRRGEYECYHHHH